MGKPDMSHILNRFEKYSTKFIVCQHPYSLNVCIKYFKQILTRLKVKVHLFRVNFKHELYIMTIVHNDYCT